MKEVYHIFRRKCHKSFEKILTDTNVTLIITIDTKVHLTDRTDTKVQVKLHLAVTKIKEKMVQKFVS